MTLNTVSAMGLLTVGIFGFPFLGAVQDHYSTQTVIAQETDKFESVKTNNIQYSDTTDPDAPVDKPIYELKNFFGVEYESVNREEFKKLLPEESQESLDESLTANSQSSLRVAAVLPLVMAIAFMMIIIYYAATGGYKPIILSEQGKN